MFIPLLPPFMLMRLRIPVRSPLSLRVVSLAIVSCAVLMCPALFSSSIAAQDKAGAPSYKVGMTFRRFTPPEPYDWRGAQTHALTTVVWYPAESSAAVKPVKIPGLGIFELGSAAPDAKPAASPSKFPLIAISHGTGGSGLSMAWLGEALAAQGYVVAAVNHPGNNGTEAYTVEGFSKWWERARDLNEVITAMLADSQFGNRIDAKRIAAAGFSLGGNTMIEIAGGLTYAEGFVRYCDTNATDGICTSPPEFPTLVEDFRKLIRDKPEVLNHAGDSYRDVRVRAVFAMAPALGPAFPVSGLKKISIPVEIVAGESDKSVPIASSAKYFAVNIPGARLHIFPGGVGHYVFLDTCTDSGRNTLAVLCVDNEGVDRDAIHKRTEQMAIKFFGKVIGNSR